jgi:hypothetical protein
MFLMNAVMADSDFGDGVSLDFAAELAALGSGIVLAAGGVFAFCWARGGEVSANAGFRETVQISSKENKNVTLRTLSEKAEECAAFVTLADIPDSGGWQAIIASSSVLGQASRASVRSGIKESSG